jgi:hypothetical protein
MSDMWQKQLISIVEGNSLDPDHIEDLLVTYEAETGDASLRGCGEVLMFMGALRPLSLSGYKFWSGYKSRSRSGSKSGFLSGSWSGSRFGVLSRSRSGPGSRSGSRSK